MELTVTERRDNPLLERTEVHFTAAHPNEPTPSRADLRKALAAALHAKDVTIVLDWARSEYGRTVTQGYAKVYKSKARALELETTPILVRNGLVAAPKAEPPAEAPAPPPKGEAPKEKSKEEKPKEPPKKEEKKAPKEEAPAKEPKEKKAAKEGAPKEEKPAKPKEAPKEKKETKKGGK